MPPREDPPRITEQDRETLEHPEEGYDPDGPPEEIDRQQERQAGVAERDKEWIDPARRSAGRTEPGRGAGRPARAPP